MNERDMSIKVFNVMGSIDKDLSNITKKLVLYHKNNPKESPTVMASVIASLCFIFISVLHHSFWQDILVKIAQELAKQR